MTRKQINRMTGTPSTPDLWHFAPGGTLGQNRGVSLLDLADMPARQPDSCERCGEPTQGLATCDQCLDGDTPYA